MTARAFHACLLVVMSSPFLQYKDALRTISRVIRDVKKFDDKLLLVEISLIESRVYLALQNIAKVNDV